MTNVRCVGAFYDHLRMFIDHPVVDSTGFVVILVFGKNDSPAKISFQLGNNFGFHGTLIRFVWRNNTFGAKTHEFSPLGRDIKRSLATESESVGCAHWMGLSKPRNSEMAPRPCARLGMASLRSYPNLGIGEGLVASSLRC